METKRKKLYIVLPVFDDWEALELLVDEIISIPISLSIHLVVVDDCSKTINESIQRIIKSKCKQNQIDIEILRMSINRGNQFAIWIGLDYLQQKLRISDLIVVMDSDGEDNPQSIPHLLASHSMGIPTVAKRGKRNNSTFFKLWHFFYRLIFRYLTNKKLDFGNFSVIDATILRRLFANEKTRFMGYAGSLLSLSPEIRRVKVDKRPRLLGGSKTSVAKLIQWGLLQISPFADVVFSQALKLSVKFMALVFGVSIILLSLRITNLYVVPGWTSTILSIFLVSSVFLTILSSMFLSLFFLVSGIRTELEIYASPTNTSLTRARVFLDSDSSNA